VIVGGRCGILVVLVVVVVPEETICCCWWYWCDLLPLLPVTLRRRERKGPKYPTMHYPVPPSCIAMHRRRRRS